MAFCLWGGLWSKCVETSIRRAHENEFFSWDFGLVALILRQASNLRQMFNRFELQLPGYDIQQEMTASVKVCLKPILTFKQRDIFYALKLHFFIWATRSWESGSQIEQHKINRGLKLWRTKKLENYKRHFLNIIHALF